MELEQEEGGQSRLITVFISSTFTDFEVERNYLLGVCLPQLRSYAQQRGFDVTLDVALSSLQWGVSEAIVNDHEVVKVCLDEIEACHRLSAGVSFFCMLGDKYGYRPPPQTLSQQTMAAAHQQLDATRRQLLDTWYCLDTNAVPPEYRLRPVTTVLGAQSEAEWPQTARELVNLLDNALASLQPASASKADSTRKLASGTQPADICVPLPSVTEMEVRQGLAHSNRPGADHAFFVVRRFSNLPTQADGKDTPIFRKFCDTLPVVPGGAPAAALEAVVKADMVAKSHLTRLEQDVVDSHARGVVRFTIPWRTTGIDESTTEHRLYIQGLGDCFMAWVRRSIDEVAAANVAGSGMALNTSVSEPGKATNAAGGASQNPLPGAANYVSWQSERDQHLKFMMAKAALCCQREATLALLHTKITQCLSSHGTALRLPLAVAGISGSGKTVLMARLAQILRSQPEFCEANVVVRFLGTTPSSSAPLPLLLSLTQELRSFLPTANSDVGTVGETAGDGLDRLLAKMPPTDLFEAQQQFQELLAHYSAMVGKPLVLLLDAVDQLDLSSHNANALDHVLHWLPAALPASMAVIVSHLMTAEDGTQADKPSGSSTRLAGGQAEMLDTSQWRHQRRSIRVSIPAWDLAAAGAALHQLCGQRKRTLTLTQQSGILQLWRQAPTPLTLHLLGSIASNWTSFDEASLQALSASRQLQHNAAGSADEDAADGFIQMFFGQLAEMFGPKLVQHALALLSLAPQGLSREELEDVLSLDDAVLDQLFKYWVPPTRRLPPLLLARVLRRLRPFLTVKSALGHRIITWYHRRFREAALAFLRASDSNDPVAKLHGHLADYFWGPSSEEDNPRQLHLQPLAYSAWNMDSWTTPPRVNVRKVEALPRHLLGAHRFETWLTATVLDPAFLTARVAALGVAQALSSLEGEFSCYLADLPPSAEPGPSDAYREAAVVRTILSTLKLAAHVLQNAPLELPAQIVARWQPPAPETREAEFYARCRELASATGFFPLQACLPAPGGFLTRTLAGHTQRVSQAKFLPSETNMIVSASSDRTLRVWNTTTGTILREMGDFRETPAQIDVCWTPAGRHFALARSGAEATLWDIDEGKLLLKLPELDHGNFFHKRITACAFVPLPDRLTSVGCLLAYMDGSLRLWHVDLPKLLGKLIFKAEPTDMASSRGISCLDALASADGGAVKPWLAAGTYAGHVHICDWTAATAEQRNCALLPHDRSVTCVRFCYAGQRCLTVEDYRAVHLWDVLQQQKLALYRPHHSWVQDLSLLAVDGRPCFVSASWDRSCSIVDIESGSALAYLDEHADCVCSVDVSADGRRAVTAADDGMLRLWDLSSLHAGRRTSLREDGHRREVVALCYVDGQQLLTGSQDNTSRLVSVKDGRSRTVSPADADLSWVIGVVRLAARPRSETTIHVALVADNGVIVTINCSAEGNVKEVGRQALKKKLSHATTLDGGKYVCCLAARKNLVVVDTLTLECVVSYQLQTEGKYLSQAAKDIVCVGNAESGATLYYWLAAKQTFVMLATVAEKTRVGAVELCGDGSLLIAGKDGLLSRWVFAEGQWTMQTSVHSGHRPGISCIAVYPGQDPFYDACATGGLDGVVCLWRLADFRLLAKFTCSSSSITALQFAPMQGTMSAVQLAVGTFEGNVVFLQQDASTAGLAIGHANGLEALAQACAKTSAASYQADSVGYAATVGAWFWKLGELVVSNEAGGRKRRFLVKRGAIIEYYKADQGLPKEKRGEIDLSQVTRVAAVDDRLLLYTKKRIWDLQEETPGQAQAWAQSLHEEYFDDLGSGFGELNLEAEN